MECGPRRVFTMKWIRILVLALTTTSCVVTVTWDSNRELPEEILYEDMTTIAEQPVPGQPYEVPPLPVGGGMLDPNPLFSFEHSMIAADATGPVSY